MRDNAEKQIVDFPVFQIQERIVEMTTAIPHERVSERNIDVNGYRAEQIRDVRVPKFHEETVEVTTVIPQESMLEVADR